MNENEKINPSASNTPVDKSRSANIQPRNSLNSSPYIPSAGTFKGKPRNPLTSGPQSSSYGQNRSNGILHTQTPTQPNASAPRPNPVRPVSPNGQSPVSRPNPNYRPQMSSQPNSQPRPSQPQMTNPRPSQAQSGDSMLSPEEKLARGSRNLSYTAGSGFGSGRMDLPRFSRHAHDPSQERKKVGGVVLDVDTIQDVTSQKMNTRDRRNRVIILVLSLALIASLLFLTITVLNYRKGSDPANCFFRIEGDAGANCEWLVEGKKLTEFNPPKELDSTSVYKLKSQLLIDTAETVVIQLEVHVECNGKPFLITQLDNPHPLLTRAENTNIFVYSGTITGPKTVDLFDGIDFTSSPVNLSSQNLTMTVKVIVNKQN